MPTKDLIMELRKWAELYPNEEQGALMTLAADRLELLDERVDIMAVEQGAEAAAGRMEMTPGAVVGQVVEALGAVIHIGRGGEIRIEVAK